MADRRTSSIMRVSRPTDLPGPLAVVCHDAGAANLILHWVGQDIVVPVQPFMAGPARTLWEARFPGHPLCESIEQALNGASCLLSGTGWASDVEHRARVLAASIGLPSIAGLDHWVNYPDRFRRSHEIQWPDAVIVTDRWARQEARKIFSNEAIFEWPNRYLEFEISQITPPPPDGDILYICEPARSNWGRDVEGEFQAIEFFLEKIDVVLSGHSRRIRFRPHPSENPQKYDAIIRGLAYAELDGSPSLGESISRSTVVGGMSSAAMIVALMSGRPVFSSLPPWAPPCPLPHDGIIHLREVGGV